MAINWEKVEEENKMKGKQYKDFAPEGEHTTKIESVEAQDTQSGSKGIRFILADNDDYSFPKFGAVAWVITKKNNVNWRIHHMKELFVALGFTEAQARKAVEQAEDAEDLTKAYLNLFEKALPKAKEVEVVVYRRTPDNQYLTWDFASSKVRMGYPEKEDKKEDVLADAVELSTEETDSLPF